MWRLASHELRGQWRLTVLVSFGLILASMAYVALLGTASGTTAVLTGDIGKAWNTPYDLLVRPAGDVTKLERTQGLVSPNFISSINGGITEAQWHAIEHVKGVSVAAPIAIVGYTTLLYTFSVPQLPAILGSAPLTVLRLEGEATAEGGRAHYPLAPQFFIIAPHGVATCGGGLTCQLSYDGKTIQCGGNAVVGCEAGTVVCHTCFGLPATFTPSSYLVIPIPVLVAGVDPRAEAQLSGLRHAMTSGKYLPNNEAAILPTSSNGAPTPSARIPVIASTKSYISETLALTASVAESPGAVMSGTSPSSLQLWSNVYHATTSVQSLYSTLTSKLGLPATDLPNVVVPGSVRYKTVGSDRFVPQVVPTVPSVLDNPNCINCGQQDIPPDARDTWFRHLQVSSRIASSSFFAFDILGTFKPNQIPGFNLLAGGDLSSYAPPEAKLSDGKTVLPTRNPAGFITSPPLMLTTLAGAQYFAGAFTGGQGNAFISAIRIRVAGTSKPSNASQAKLEKVAAAINERTGLQVSLVKGSSALPVNISVPKGKFGEPPMTVTEYWGKEGAAITFLRGLNVESLVLFLLTLGVVLALLGVVGQLGVRRRSQEFGMLRAIGWPLWQVVRLMLTEMALLGAGIGVVTAAAAVGVSRILDPAIPIGPLLLVIPLVLVMAVSAPLPALLASSRSSASSALRTESALGRLRVRSVRSLALRELLGPWRVESLFCAGSSAIGSGLVGGVVLVVGGFAGQLGRTTLGHYLGAQVGPLDVVLVAIAAVAGASASATLLTLAYLERQVEFSTLRAVGWPRGSVTAVIAIQALVLGLGGGLAAAGAVAAGGVAMGAPLSVTVVAPMLSVLVALVTMAVAMTGTLYLAYRLGPAEALRAT